MQTTFSFGFNFHKFECYWLTIDFFIKKSKPTKMCDISFESRFFKNSLKIKMYLFLLNTNVVALHRFYKTLNVRELLDFC